MNTGWDAIVEKLRPDLEAKHQAREAILGRCRTLIQTCAKSIRHVHRNQIAEAQQLLRDAKQMSQEVRSVASDQPEILYAGQIADAEKELVEASALLAMVLKEPYETREALGVGLTSYLNGMAEAASECRRYVLDEMRKGKMEEAERLLGEMEAIYDDLITFDYPDGLTGGLRRSCDALRAVVERTRNDLVITESQRELLDELRKRP